MENIINIKNINKLKEDDKNNKIENLIEYHKKTVNDIINNLNKLTLDAFFEIENKIEEDVFFKINNYVENIYNQRNLRKEELHNIITYVDWVTTTEPLRTLIYLPTFQNKQNKQNKQNQQNSNNKTDIFLFQKHTSLAFEFYKNYEINEKEHLPLENECNKLVDYIFSIPEEKEISFFETDGTINKLNIPAETYFKKNKKLRKKMTEIVNFGLYSFIVDQNIKHQAAGFVLVDIKSRIYLIGCVNEKFYMIDKNLVNDIFDLKNEKYHLSKMPLPVLKKEQILSYYPS